LTTTRAASSHSTPARDAYDRDVRVADGKIVEGWFIGQAADLKQIGARMPERKDGKLIGRR
jgi:hypothetical protein